MSDSLTISGGGSYAVASDTLFTDAQALEAVRDELSWAAAALGRIDSLAGEPALRGAGAPPSAIDAEREIARARHLLGSLDDRAGALAFALRASAEGYGRADAAARRVAQDLAANLGYSLGALLPVLAAVAAPALPPLLAGVLVGSLVFPDGMRRAADGLGDWLGSNNRLLTNPVAVTLIRNGVMSIDDVIGGALGVPPALVRTLGAEGLGVAGVASSAGLFTALGPRAGLLAETAVATHPRVQRDGGPPPRGLAERLDRIPQRVTTADGEPAGQHVRIERYSAPGRADRFEVYITGTADFSPRAGADPFDLTSDVGTMAGLPAGAVRAVEQAMRQEGITAASPVQFTGYSQGGLIAATLGASGDYNTQGVVAIGSPTGQIAVGGDYPAVLLEHTDDLVPALGGNRSGHDAILVEREAFAGRATPDGVAVPAHDRGEYRRTAQLADEAGSAQLIRAVDRLDGFTAGMTNETATSYVAERVAR